MLNGHQKTNFIHQRPLNCIYKLYWQLRNINPAKYWQENESEKKRKKKKNTYRFWLDNFWLDIYKSEIKH